MALLQKWKWRFLREPDAIWVKVIKSIHGSCGGLRRVNPKPIGGGVWRSFILLYDNMHEKIPFLFLVSNGI